MATSPYELRNGMYVRSAPVQHREQEYDNHGFDILSRMQERHFWYRGRHRFLNHAVRRHAARSGIATGSEVRPRAIDLGGGCGGWLAYFEAARKFPLSELALGDSSLVALDHAAKVLPPHVARFQIDLLDLQWENRWELAFLLDVLEHIPDDARVLQEIYRALSPGGLLFVTTPALHCFWSWNDELAFHQRRYSKGDFKRLAEKCGFRLRETRYFMFFLSPLLIASRLANSKKVKTLSHEEQQRLLEKTHRVPPAWINEPLSLIFSCETPLGHAVPFPWGTSVLAVLEKPR